MRGNAKIDDCIREVMIMEKNKRVILVSGMSGAGKSTATRMLEDMGYHVIDNFPVQLVSLLVDMIETSTDPRYSYLALSTTAQDFAAFLRGLKGQNIEVQVLFLEASDSVLLHRQRLCNSLLTVKLTGLHVNYTVTFVTKCGDKRCSPVVRHVGIIIPQMQRA